MSIFSFGFMQRALVAGLLVGLVCAVLSVYIVLRRMAFVGHGIGHASFGGVALGVLAGINTTLMALVFCVATAVAIGLVSQRKHVSEDSAIGIFLVAAMALGVLFISLKKTFVDVEGFLFGNILAVSHSDIIFIIVITVIVLGLVALFFKELFYFSFDEEMAAVSGIPVNFIRFMLLILIALTVVVAIKVVGVILVSALLVIPAVCATQLTLDFKAVMGISILVGLIANFGGLLFSYYLNAPSGATIVLVLFGLFLLTYGFRGVKEILQSR